VLPLSWSLDHVGPMARTVADGAAMLQAIAGYDPHEPTSAQQPVPDFMQALAAPTRGLRLGVPRAYAEKLDPDIDAAFAAALGVLATLTASRADVDFAPSADDRTAIRATEAFAYHAAYVARSPELYTPAVLARIRTGERISAVAYIEARRRMEQLRRDGHPVFDQVDVLVAPTTPVLPIAIKDGQQLRNVAPLNLTGFPAVSVPCGFSKSRLPIGLQLIAPAWQEERLIALASAYERATAWHTKRPA
jgi:aspartyl-tRNA(Asn)/glutamyl-tRNA(Gln) amidotransferase subunit A